MAGGSKVRLKSKGVNEAIALLKDLPNEMKDTVLTEALHDGAEVVYRAVLAKAPRHHGKQSKSSQTYGSILENLRRFKLRFNVPLNAVIYRVSSGDAFWGNFLEHGTRFFPAMPWFRPAVRSSSAACQKVVIDRIKRGFESSVAKLLRKA